MVPSQSPQTATAALSATTPPQNRQSRGRKKSRRFNEKRLNLSKLAKIGESPKLLINNNKL
jgi:hypothetical protein